MLPPFTEALPTEPVLNNTPEQPLRQLNRQLNRQIEIKVGRGGVIAV